MADFIIPKGKAYTFTIKVMEKDSFLPQDLTYTATATIELLLLSTGASVFTTVMTVDNALNGVLKCTIPTAQTDLLTIDRGPKVDGYYLRPTHQALITVTFTETPADNTADPVVPAYTDPTIFTILNEVFVAPTSTLG